MRTARLFQKIRNFAGGKPRKTEKKEQKKLWVWLSLTQSLSLFDEDTRFWWTTTAPILARMMELVGYSQELQHKHLLFYYIYVLPSLGKRPSPEGCPDGWHSFMTDDFSPLEFSWEWGLSAAESRVRFSIEPIGKCAGTPTDPLNQKSVFELVDRLRSTFQNTLDLTVFKVLCEALTTTREKLDTKDISVDGRSQYFVAFDLDAGNPCLKAYFIPGLKAVETNTPVPELLVKAMNSCEVHCGSRFMEAFRRFNSDLMKFSTISSNRPEIEIVGIDCVVPSNSRVKIYVRYRETSFDSVQRMLSLGAKEPLNSASVASLRELWSLVLGLPKDFSSSHELPNVPHRTSGVLYYFEIRPNSDCIVPKVYIPVRHYAHNDLSIAQGLATYFQSRGQTVAANNYVEALSDIL
jgi:DMATS type aromatic prenyltransferase